jgi:hypothetical protein
MLASLSLSRSGGGDVGCCLRRIKLLRTDCGRGALVPTGFCGERAGTGRVRRLMSLARVYSPPQPDDARTCGQQEAEILKGSSSETSNAGSKLVLPRLRPVLRERYKSYLASAKCPYIEGGPLMKLFVRILVVLVLACLAGWLVYLWTDSAAASYIVSVGSFALSAVAIVLAFHTSAGKSIRSKLKARDIDESTVTGVRSAGASGDISSTVKVRGSKKSKITGVDSK